MATPADFWIEPESINDMQFVLLGQDRLTPQQMTPKICLSMLSGFRVIVQTYEGKQPGQDQEVNEYIILKWMSVYYDLFRFSKCLKADMNIFSKYIPVTVTFFIGCLLNVSNVSPDFYKDFMTLAIQVIRRTDVNILKKLQHCGKGLIAYLWTVIDKVGDYNSQLMVVRLVQEILKSFDDNAAVFEVERIDNLNAAAKETLLKLTKMNYYDFEYTIILQEILNYYNSLKGNKALVFSFSCESINFGNKYRFAKSNYRDCMWININSQPLTVTFEGYFCSENHVDGDRSIVSLKIKSFFCDEEKLIIECIPPAFVTSHRNLEELSCMSEATVVLPRTGMNRFLKALKGNDPVSFIHQYSRQGVDMNKATLNSNAIEGETGTFKKPSLELFETGLGVSKSKTKHTAMAPNESKCLEDLPRPAELPNIDTGQPAVSNTRRFFKNPRTPKQMELPCYPHTRSQNSTKEQQNKPVTEIKPVVNKISPQKRTLIEDASDIQEKRQCLLNENVFDYTKEGPTSSKYCTKMPAQMEGRKTRNGTNLDQRNNVETKKASNIYHGSLKTLGKNTKEKIKNSFSKSSDNNITSTTSSQPNTKKTAEIEPIKVTNSKNEPKEQNNSYTVSGKQTKKRRTSHFSRNIWNSDLSTSCEDSEFKYPKRKKVLKKRRSKK